MDEEHVFIGVYAPNKIEVNSLVQFFSFSVDAMIGKFFFLLVHLCMYVAVQFFSKSLLFPAGYETKECKGYM